MAAFRTDGTFTSASAVGQARTSYPIDGDTTAKIIAQDFMVLFANYAAPTLGSAHGTFTTAYCIGDSELQDLGAGLARYTRQWATVPATRDEFGSFVFTFPGLLGSSSPPYSQYWVADIGGGRDPRTETVNSRIANEYFLCIAGQTYETAGEIPILEGFRVKLSSNDDAVMPYALPAGVYWSDTVPTKEDYESSIAAGDEIVAEDSAVDRYAGPIFVRTTRYVKAI